MHPFTAKLEGGMRVGGRKVGTRLVFPLPRPRCVCKGSSSQHAIVIETGTVAGLAVYSAIADEKRVKATTGEAVTGKSQRNLSPLAPAQTTSYQGGLNNTRALT